MTGTVDRGMGTERAQPRMPPAGNRRPRFPVPNDRELPPPPSGNTAGPAPHPFDRVKPTK
ncbi:hypothetical protein MTP06_23830 [Streptomyces sp. PLM4]|nr:hypothetical protein MTP06_23830 [Streptomyces sp. PLM4]